jgi:hypothetical protein
MTPEEQREKVRKYKEMCDTELLRRIGNDELIITKLQIAHRDYSDFLKDPCLLRQRFDRTDSSLRRHTLERDLKKLVYLARKKLK